MALIRSPFAVDAADVSVAAEVKSPLFGFMLSFVQLVKSAHVRLADNANEVRVFIVLFFLKCFTGLIYRSTITKGKQ